MSCYFGSIGADVTAADNDKVLLDTTLAKAESLGIDVNGLRFNGDYDELPSGFDFVFTKSALVMTGCAAIRAAQIPRLLRPGGEYIGVENLEGGFIARAARLRKHTSPTFSHRFSPISNEVKSVLRKVFATVQFLHLAGPVVAIRAKRQF